MDQPETKASSDQQQGPNQGNSPTGGTITQAGPKGPVVNATKSAAADVRAKRDETKRSENYRARGKKFFDWISTIAAGEAILAVTAIMALFIAFRQNTLITNQNVLMDKQNDIVTRQNEIELQGAKATEASAKADTVIAAMTIAGEDSNKKTAEAIQDTARATNETAKVNANAAQATRDVATASKDSVTALATVAAENAKTAKATERAVEISERALGISNQASVNAGRAAKAAEDAVTITKKSVELAAATTIHELRAYMSIKGTELRYDAAGNRMVATITLENTGKTPAHNIELSWNVTCTTRP